MKKPLDQKPEIYWCEKCAKEKNCTYWNEYSLKCKDYVRKPGYPDATDIETVLDEIVLDEVGWEGSENVMTFNGDPIGLTFRRAEIPRWWPSLKTQIAMYLAEKL